MHEGWVRFGDQYASERAYEVRLVLSTRLTRDPLVVLDVGGGDASLGVGIGWPGARVVCLDLDWDRLRIGLAEARRRHLPATFAAADVSALPIRSASCDVVLLYGILELLEHPERLARETSRVLRAGGVGYLVVPNPLSPITVFDDPHTHLPFTHLLPARVARGYAQRFMRRRVKEIGKHFALPSYGRLQTMFARAGLRLERVSNLMRIEEPSLVLSPRKRRLAAWLRATGALRFAHTPPGGMLLGVYDRWIARSWAFVITPGG